MKKLVSIVMTMALVLAFCSCEKDNGQSNLKPDESVVSVGAEGGAVTVSYSLEEPVEGASVTAECSADWIGDFTYQEKASKVTFVVAPNEGEAREATVVLKYQSLKADVLVKQAKKGEDPEKPEKPEKPGDPDAAESFEFTVNGVSFNMIRVQGGTFMMGATEDQGAEADPDEKPAHKVTVSDFYIGEMEVTQQLWKAVMGSNPSWFQSENHFADNLRRPVENVSWNQVVNEFLPKLNELTGQKFVLPTEAQWEFAARGGNESRGYRYSGGDLVDDFAWHNGNSGTITQTVGTKKPNELGLYDMSGNVREWCSDWYGAYSSDAQTDPTGAESGSERIQRGGAACGIVLYCRVACRLSGGESQASFNTGVRLALAGSAKL